MRRAHLRRFGRRDGYAGGSALRDNAGRIGLLALGLGFGCTAPAPALARSPQPTSRTVQVVLTSQDLHHALARRRDVAFSASRLRGVLRGIPVIHVNDRVRYQQIIGFGGAMTDSAAWLLYDELPASARGHVMRALFSPAGIHLNFLRLPIGASDFTVLGRPYSYDDLPPGRSDPALRHFSIAHDYAYIIPALRLMREIDPEVRILAEPWSAPGWMKANHALSNRNYRGTLLPAAYEPLARYFVKFLQAYLAQGVPIDAIAPQNEPRAPTSYPGMNFSAAEQAYWIVRDLRPALRAARLHPRLFGLDGSRLADARKLLAGPARRALSGIAWHCYGGLDGMSTLHRAVPFLREVVSECSPGIIPYSAVEVAIDATRNWAGAVDLWNLALDPAGGPVEAPNTGCSACTGLVTIDEATHRSRYNLSYYQVGQVSRYVQRGAVRIGSDRLVSDFHRATVADQIYAITAGANQGYGVSAGIDDVAFHNPDGTIVLIAYNNSTLARRFAVWFHGRAFVYRLGGGSAVTFLWKQP